MIWLSDSQLASMRQQVGYMLPETAVISAPTITTDSAGAVTKTYAAVTGGTVSCRLDPLSLRGAQIEYPQARETLLLQYQLTLPHNAPIAADYRVTIAARSYEVVQLDDVHSWNVSRRGIVTEVR